MNKQELIDKAVHESNGLWPMIRPEDEYAGLYDDGVSVLCHCGSGKKHYTGWNVYKYEFEQRARELGYINGYRYGVEYPTNGKKPDLPEDASVQVRNDVYAFWTCGQVGGLSWSNVFKFKITDQRYKPADTSYLDSVSEITISSCQYIGGGSGGFGFVSEIPESKSNAENVSDWYDYEAQQAISLPPVGTKCQVWIDEVFVDCTVIHHANNSVQDVAAFKASQFEYCDVGRLGWSVDFRPLDHNRKAEAEKKRVVDAAYDEAIKAGCVDFGQWLSVIYDAGFLRMPAE
jgi:hypothetical protein